MVRIKRITRRITKKDKTKPEQHLHITNPVDALKMQLNGPDCYLATAKALDI